MPITRGLKAIKIPQGKEGGVVIVAIYLPIKPHTLHPAGNRGFLPIRSYLSLPVMHQQWLAAAQNQERCCRSLGTAV